MNVLPWFLFPFQTFLLFSFLGELRDILQVVLPFGHAGSLSGIWVVYSDYIHLAYLISFNCSVFDSWANLPFFMMSFFTCSQVLIVPEGLHLGGRDYHCHTCMIRAAHWFHGIHTCNSHHVYLCPEQLAYWHSRLLVARPAVSFGWLDFSLMIFFILLIPLQNHAACSSHVK